MDKINFNLLNSIYKGFGHIYIDTINYHSSNDIKFLLNNEYYIHKRFYRENVYKLYGVYFDNDNAKIIYFHILKFCYLSRIINPDLSINECLTKWKDNFLDKFVKESPEQVLEEKHGFFQRIIKLFKHK